MQTSQANPTSRVLLPAGRGAPNSLLLCSGPRQLLHQPAVRRPAPRSGGPRRAVQMQVQASAKLARRARERAQAGGRLQYIELDPDCTETWRLDAVVDSIRSGGVS